MALQYINKGTSANSGTGTPARTAADMINANFDYLLGLILAVKIRIGDFLVLKASGNTDNDNFETNDVFEVTLNGNRYCIGVIIDATNLNLPGDLTDIDDDTKVKLLVDNI